FQAEDGIRDFHVTGVQTCALPISLMHLQPLMPLWTLIPLFTAMLAVCLVLLVRRGRQRPAWIRRTLMVLLLLAVALRPVTPLDRSEERRVGKGGRTRVGLAG